MRRSATDRKYEAAKARQLTEEATQSKPIPTVPLKFCEYDKTRKVLKLSSEFFGMPLTFFVQSHHTGRVVRFVPVTPADKLFDQDQWDGEYQIYRPVDSEYMTRVDHLVIYNQH